MKEINTNITGYGKDIIYVNSKYYMVSYNPAKVCVSEDLENWTEYALNSNYLKPKNIVYGNGVFVITGDGVSNALNTYIYTSTNGTTWTARTISSLSPASCDIEDLKFVNNKFVFCTNMSGYKNDDFGSYNYFYESKNGTSWTKHEFFIKTTGTIYAKSLTYNPKAKRYVRIGENGSVYTSNNLSSWIKRNSNISTNLNSIVYAKNKYVAVGNNGIILTSSDGITWEKQNSGINNNLLHVYYANGNFNVMGYNGTILQSLDGILWKNISITKIPIFYGAVFYNDKFVFVGNHNDNNKICIYYYSVERNITSDLRNDSIFFFSKNLDMLGIVDKVISLRWRRKFFEAGEFEIEMEITDYILNLIDLDVIVMRNNYTEAGIIDTIEYIDDRSNITVKISGNFLSSLLDRRIIKSTLNFSGNSIEGMNYIVNNMTALTSNFEVQTPTITSKAINFQATYKNVYDYMIRLSEYANVGFRLVPNVENKTYIFEHYTGTDRTNTNTNYQYTFSDDNLNVETSSLTISNKEKVNYVLVGGKGEGSERKMEEVTNGTPSGFNLFESFSDQKSLSDEDLTSTQYTNQLKDIGKSLFCDGTDNLDVSANCINDYKIKWDLGDVVNIDMKKWNRQITQRIIEVEEVIEENKKTLYPVFGSPLSKPWKDN